ncbi:MAG: DUF6155 family protein [Cytophagales bacterium]|nr:DUF6155 family protein [Cytophagales bacterium]
MSKHYKKFKPGKENFDFYLNPDETDILNRYKERVQEGFYPKRGDQLKLSISRKAISDFKKLGTSAGVLADLMLFYVECGVEFTNDFGDINESFYISIETTFAKTLKSISKEDLLPKFGERAGGATNYGSCLDILVTSLA